MYTAKMGYYVVIANPPANLILSSPNILWPSLYTFWKVSVIICRFVMGYGYGVKHLMTAVCEDTRAPQIYKNAEKKIPWKNPLAVELSLRKINIVCLFLFFYFDGENVLRAEMRSVSRFIYLLLFSTMTCFIKARFLLLLYCISSE